MIGLLPQLSYLHNICFPESWESIRFLDPYRTSIDYPTVIPDSPSSTFTSPQPFPLYPPPSPPPSRRRHIEEIEDILEAEIVLTGDGGYQRYLVCWREGPGSDCTWLRADEIMHLSPNLFDGITTFAHSQETNVSKSGRVDGDHTGFRRRCKTWVQIYGGPFYLFYAIFYCVLSFICSCTCCP